MSWNPTFRLIRYPAVFCVAVLLLVACGGDGEDTATGASETDQASTASTASPTADSEPPATESPTTESPTTEPPITEPPTTATPSTSPEADGDTTTTSTIGADPSPGSTEQGVVAVRLQDVDGYFIEGFEIGLRFETATKEVIAATLWSDFVLSTGDDGIDAYYDSVLEQSVPAGTITILATANVGMGPGPVIPDPNGALDCRLTVEVPADGRIDVEVGFDDGNCLREL